MISYRASRWEDLEELVALDARKWDESTRANVDKWESRLNVFPEGVRVAENNGRIVGVLCAHVMDCPMDRFITWEEASDNGYMRNYTESGNRVYGVNISVDSEVRGVARGLFLDSLNNVSRPRGLPWRGGYRAPFVSGYMEKNGLSEISADRVLGLAYEDPIINKVFLALGFEILGVQERYFSGDVLSREWGVIVEADSELANM